MIELLETSELIPLSEAAHRLEVPYLKARDLLLTGVLKGTKRTGRWMVDPESLPSAKRTIRRGR